MFHIPGKMIGNTVVVEVKGKMYEYQDECIDDFSKLILFVEKYQYKIGIFILYNHSLLELNKFLSYKLNEKFQHKNMKILENILIICKKRI